MTQKTKQFTRAHQISNTAMDAVEKVMEQANNPAEEKEAMKLLIILLQDAVK